MNKTKNIILNISFIALFSALTFICTYFIVIPYAGGLGYFNFSDSLIIFSSICFGPIVGSISGIIGTVISDLLLGYSLCAPFTLIAKGLEALLAYFLFKKLHNNKIMKTFSYYLATIPMILVYFIYYLIAYNGDVMTSLISSGFDVIQGVVGASFSLLLSYILKDIPLIKKRINI